MLLDILYFGVPAQVCFRKEAFIKAGGFNSQLDNFVDIDTWIRIAQFGDAILLNHVLAYYTSWQGSFYQLSLAKNLESNIMIKEKIYHLLPDKFD